MVMLAEGKTVESVCELVTLTEHGSGVAGAAEITQLIGARARGSEEGTYGEEEEGAILTNFDNTTHWSEISNYGKRPTITLTNQTRHLHRYERGDLRAAV